MIGFTDLSSWQKCKLNKIELVVRPARALLMVFRVPLFVVLVGAAALAKVPAAPVDETIFTALASLQRSMVRSLPRMLPSGSQSRRLGLLLVKGCLGFRSSCGCNGTGRVIYAFSSSVRTWRGQGGRALPTFGLVKTIVFFIKKNSLTKKNTMKVCVSCC